MPLCVLHVCICWHSNNASGFETCIACMFSFVYNNVCFSFFPRMRSCPEGNLSLIGQLWQPVMNQSLRHRQSHRNWSNQRHLALGHMHVRWLTTALPLRLCASAWTCHSPQPANSWMFCLAGGPYGWPQTLISHFEMSHHISQSGESLTDMSFVLSRPCLNAFGFALNTFPMSHHCEQMQDSTCVCFAHSANLLNCSA